MKNDVLSVVKDVDRIKNPGQKTQEERKLFGALPENNLDCFGIYSAIRDKAGHIVDFRIDYVNEAACKNNRMSKKKQIGKSLLELLPSHRENGLFDEYCQVVETGKPFVKESLIYEDEYNQEGIARTFDIRAVKLGDGFAAFWCDVTEQRKMEASIKEANGEWKATFDAISDLVSVHDKDFNFVRVNRAFADFFGMKPEDLIGKKCYEVIHQTNKHWPNCPHRTTLETKESRTIEFFEPRLRIWAEVSISPIFAEEGEVTGSVHIIKDITERKKIEEELRRVSNLYESVLDNAGISINVAGMNGKLISVSKGTEDIFGYRAEELLGKHVSIFYRKGDDETQRKVWRDAVQKGKFEGQVTLVKKDKKEFDAHLIVTPIRGDDGKPTALVGISKDITEEKKAEEALQKSEEKHRTLVETSSDCICNLDLNGGFLYMSPAGLKSHNLSLEQIKGVHCTELAEPIYRPLLNETLEKAKNGEPVRFQYESNTISGVRWIESTLTPIKDNSGRITSLLRLSRDITENKQSEEKLRKSLERLRKTLEETVNALASMVEKKDPYTAGHQQRVSQLACAIAKEMCFSEKRIEGIRVAALVHDIGKIHIPSEILSKPSQLTEIEFEVIKSHVKAGYEILKTIEFPWPVAKIVLQHQERIDGSGYPSGLSGEEIILEAKILSVADIVEAISSHRPYRPALGINKALEEISAKKGILYDPKVVDSCLRLFTEKRFSFEEKTEKRMPTKLLFCPWSK